jgi:hypothetical protein
MDTGGREMRKMLVLLLVVFLAGQGLALRIAHAETGSTRQGQISADRLNVRSGPGTTNAVVASAANGETVTILGEEGDWFKVELASGTVGWVAKKFVTESAPAAPENPKGEAGKPAPATSTSAPKIEEKKSGGGLTIGTVLKWGCFLGAGAVGYLAYNEHTQGNDAYDEYKADVQTRGISPSVAEPKRLDAKDHDSTSLTYSMVAGGLFGAFLVQQFFLGGDDEGSAELDSDRALPLSFDPVTKAWRAQIVLARF